MIEMELVRLGNAADGIGRAAARCLRVEIVTAPKPGLVSRLDSGAHDDMDMALMLRSVAAIEPYLDELAAAGAASLEMDALRAIGMAAETAMLGATDGINTHRGAIFGMGLLCAAAGLRRRHRLNQSLGAIVSARWGRDILRAPVTLRSHGGWALLHHCAGGARAEAACGFPSLYRVALPALRVGRRIAGAEPEAARVHALMALVAAVEDTNLLYRGGREGLAYARAEAKAFLSAGGVGAPNWRSRALVIHAGFVARQLSPGGCADLLAMALFVDGEEE